MAAHLLASAPPALCGVALTALTDIENETDIEKAVDTLSGFKNYLFEDQDGTNRYQQLTDSDPSKSRMIDQFLINLNEAFGLGIDVKALNNKVEPVKLPKYKMSEPKLATRIILSMYS